MEDDEYIDGEIYLDKIGKAPSSHEDMQIELDFIKTEKQEEIPEVFIPQDPNDLLIQQIDEICQEKPYNPR
jgi:hypothetical protein